ncbi:hypothetical protein GCM10009127_11770 [Alteraurantiacibacter aestuarii]|uniref:Uncharacterized protein n=1 Tax=Alteraurantiacibacter aestuarii TaxID=650004 RepID=A0A844ZJD2_9SPHN|nr:hypothetical protein [Alteraurantiacibacter aestuarii]MXO87563.1 hypothetical protein [Alteraurantiacibacter aestuarii]
MVLRSTRRKAGRGAAARTDTINRDETDQAATVPGLTANPATNLLMADIVMRAGSYVLRRFVERSFLKGRYGTDAARQIVRNKSLSSTLTSVVIARVATRSVPGAALVGTGILAKTLYERGKRRRDARMQGNNELLDRTDT